MPVEVYGSPIIHSFFDRDLALAFRLILKDGTVHLGSIPNFARISNLAIHLAGKTSDPTDLQTATTPFVALLPRAEGQYCTEDPTCNADQFNLQNTLLNYIKDHPQGEHTQQAPHTDRAHEKPQSASLLSADCFLIDSQPPACVGAFGDMLASSRLDNLSSVWASLYAFIQSFSFERDDIIRIFVAFDHEEVGSLTFAGARGAFLQSILQRIFTNLGLDQEDLSRALARSFCASCDATHAFNPSYPSKYDSINHPIMGLGPCVKVHANQHYATDAVTLWAASSAAKASGVNLQNFISNNSVGCGSTIGPMIAAQIGIRTFDWGVPILSMHSARELASLRDLANFLRVLCAFFIT